MIQDAERGRANGPLLLDGADDIARRCRDLDALQAAGKEAGGAGQRPMHVDYLLLKVVEDPHVKGTGGAAAVPGATVVVLYRVVDLLAEGILDRKLVVGLKAGEGLEQLDLLLNQKLVDSRKVLQSARTVRNSGRYTHPVS